MSTKNKKKVKDESDHEELEEEDDEEEEIEEDEEEEDIEDEEIYLESENKDCDIEDAIEKDNIFFDNNDEIENKSIPAIKYVTGDERMSSNKLTRYEMVRIFGERTKQLTMGAKTIN
jgi:hypothetical protein